MNIQELFDLINRKVSVEEFKNSVKQHKSSYEKKYLEEVERKRTAERLKSIKERRAAKIIERDTKKEDGDFIDYLNQVDLSGNTLLHAAVLSDSFDIVEELMGIGLS